MNKDVYLSLILYIALILFIAVIGVISLFVHWSKKSDKMLR